MTARVYKYPLENTIDVQTISGPGLGKLILFGLQDQIFCVWGESDDARIPMTRRVQIIPTGGTIPWDWRHVMSCQEGGFVWHLYCEPI